MSKFNQRSPGTKTENIAGGEAYSQSPELELVSILLTSFVSDSFYEKTDDTITRFKGLVAKCKPEFVAKAAVYARKVFGMRSITHIAASELAKHAAGQSWAKSFYEAVVQRPDDITEIVAYYLANNANPSNKTKKRGKKTLPGAMKKGLAAAFGKFDTYTLAKYRGENKSVKLVDVVNLVRPKPIEKNGEAIKALINGDLKSLGTWETQLTQAGQKAENEEEKEEFKKDVWENLIKQNKLPIFALLRNLRNIIEQAPKALDGALAMLTNEDAIGKSKIFPFRFLTAYEEIQKVASGADARKVLAALSKAMDISTKNVPVFEGRTLVVLDVSGSMTTMTNPKNKMSPARIGSVFAAVLAKANNADLMTFDSASRFVKYNPADTTITIVNGIPFNGGGTDFRTIFDQAAQPYDRIFILSDMQAWVGNHTPTRNYNLYKQRTGANPFIYSFDLNGYGTMQFPENKVFAIAGFSDKIFGVIKMLETDKNALINEINKIEL